MLWRKILQAAMAAAVVVAATPGPLACTAISATTTEPIRPHPENPHYFLWRGKPVVLITAGEHYGAMLNLDFEYVRYLDQLKANRFNLTRIFSGTYREVAG